MLTFAKMTELNIKNKPRFDLECYEAARAAGIKSIVKRFSRGNVRLQRGQYITHERLEQMRDNLAQKYK